MNDIEDIETQEEVDEINQEIEEPSLMEQVDVKRILEVALRTKRKYDLNTVSFASPSFSYFIDVI